MYGPRKTIHSQNRDSIKPNKTSIPRIKDDIKRPPLQNLQYNNSSSNDQFTSQIFKKIILPSSKLKNRSQNVPRNSNRQLLQLKKKRLGRFKVKNLNKSKKNIKNRLMYLLSIPNSPIPQNILKKVISYLDLCSLINLEEYFVLYYNKFIHFKPILSQEINIRKLEVKIMVNFQPFRIEDFERYSSLLCSEVKYSKIKCNDNFTAFTYTSIESDLKTICIPAKKQIVYTLINNVLFNMNPQIYSKSLGKFCSKIANYDIPFEMTIQICLRLLRGGSLMDIYDPKGELIAKIIQYSLKVIKEKYFDTAYCFLKGKIKSVRKIFKYWIRTNLSEVFSQQEVSLF